MKNKKATISRIYKSGYEYNGRFLEGRYQYEVLIDGEHFTHVFFYPEEAESFCEEHGYDYETNY